MHVCHVYWINRSDGVPVAYGWQLAKHRTRDCRRQDNRRFRDILFQKPLGGVGHGVHIVWIKEVPRGRGSHLLLILMYVIISFLCQFLTLCLFLFPSNAFSHFFGFGFWNFSNFRIWFVFSRLKVTAPNSSRLEEYSLDDKFALSRHHSAVV